MTMAVPAYGEVLHTLKQKIRQAQVKAALAVNAGMRAALLGNRTNHIAQPSPRRMGNKGY